MLITPENAAEFAAKSVEARRRKAEAARERAEKLNGIAKSAVEESQDFQNQRLSRVRAQLNKLDEMISEELDPAKLDRLASAQARLSDQEFALSGRHKPGLTRPGRQPTKTAPASFEPSE